MGFISAGHQPRWQAGISPAGPLQKFSAELQEELRDTALGRRWRPAPEDVALPKPTDGAPHGFPPEVIEAACDRLGILPTMITGHDTASMALLPFVKAPVMKISHLHTNNTVKASAAQRKGAQDSRLAEPVTKSYIPPVAIKRFRGDRPMPADLFDPASTIQWPNVVAACEGLCAELMKVEQGPPGTKFDYSTLQAWGGKNGFHILETALKAEYREWTWSLDNFVRSGGLEPCDPVHEDLGPAKNCNMDLKSSTTSATLGHCHEAYSVS